MSMTRVVGWGPFRWRMEREVRITIDRAVRHAAEEAGRKSAAQRGPAAVAPPAAGRMALPDVPSFGIAHHEATTSTAGVETGSEIFDRYRQLNGQLVVRLSRDLINAVSTFRTALDEIEPHLDDALKADQVKFVRDLLYRTKQFGRPDQLRRTATALQEVLIDMGQPEIYSKGQPVVQLLDRICDLIEYETDVASQWHSTHRDAPEPDAESPYDDESTIESKQRW